MESQVRFGKIKVYGKMIDLDNTSIEDLTKMKKILDKRLDVLVNKYIDLYNKING